MELINEAIEIDKLKNTLIKRVAEQQGYPKEVVDKVINFQFRELIIVLKERSDVEIAGMGKIMISRPMTTRKLNKSLKQRNNILLRMEKPNVTPHKLKTLNDKLEGLNETIAFLEEKLRIYADKH